MSVQSGRPRRPRRSPLVLTPSDHSVIGSWVRVSDVMVGSSGGETAQSLAQPLKFVIEIQGAALCRHGGQPLAATFGRPDPHPYPALANVKHGKHAQNQQHTADIDRGLPRAAGNLE